VRQRDRAEGAARRSPTRAGADFPARREIFAQNYAKLLINKNSRCALQGSFSSVAGKLSAVAGNSPGASGYVRNRGHRLRSRTLHERYRKVNRRRHCANSVVVGYGKQTNLPWRITYGFWRGHPHRLATLARGREAVGLGPTVSGRSYSAATASISIRNSGWARAVTATSVCAGIFLPKNSSRIGP
jgi:hypothetical protein